MSLKCYRCGSSLTELPLPLGRLDECPDCETQLHVCRMCVSYDPKIPKACAEDDAIEVRDKRSANFCDYFKPSDHAYAPGEYEADLAARAEFSALFGDSLPEGGELELPGTEDTSPSALEEAEALFKGD